MKLQVGQRILLKDSDIEVEVKQVDETDNNYPYFVESIKHGHLFWIAECQIGAMIIKEVKG